jgi:CHAT domain-containing protein
MPVGRRYALDEMLLTYTPNARALVEARYLAERAAAEKALAVEDPSPTAAAPLIHADREVQAVRAAFDRVTVLRHREATRSAVLAALADYPVLHFACHGYFNPEEPLDSALLLAEGEELRLRDFLERRLAGARLAVLSACETAVPSARLPDELVALPSGLMQAGVPSVIASLWSVADLSTMMLMVRFYDLWRNTGLQPPEALRLAQLWVRDSTNAEKREYLPDLLELAGAKVPALAKGFWEEARAHAHPYHWAGFAHLGA